MWQACRVAMPRAGRQAGSIVARRSKCKNCKKMYLLNTSVCANTYCSLDCQSNFLYLEHVSGRLRSFFEEAKLQQQQHRHHALPDSDVSCVEPPPCPRKPPPTATTHTTWLKARSD
ncbi:hypothetical protein DYB37_003739 [Aphanomyces astaci]|uniref:Uncharacterized protein n=1 Tax=Aphanomyces astaci TaxID=112090 RepID=A0A397FJN5_APHAT|nr:hypothetical protein DYB36_000184 [Aphanomyces astaci]RHY21106.1 hypothetical protein DYB25_009165 [Aphanomyces astaci]RHY36302.1 hypothetical protein DYB34_000895 [Aphanomyces astaci]RHY63221.1 hypothetical protein DYB30_003742 [Aphanomyces astaci]RHY65041.1 hypothetical protein DYB38_001249 [Aphanomyces astaci]